MSYLHELIQTLCPDGVEHLEAKKVCEFKRGQSITKQTMTEGRVPVIAGGQKPAYFCDKSNRNGESIIVSSSGAYAGFVSYWDEPIFVSDAFTVEPNEQLLVKFLYYVLINKQERIHSAKRGVGVPHVHGSDIAQLLIPIPPLPVQEEIVRILDTFTNVVAELEKELEAELEARIKQFEHYRDELLTLSNCEHKKFGGLAVIVRGASPRPINNYLTNDKDGVNWIKIGDVLPESKFITSTKVKVTVEGARASRMVHPGDFVLSNSMSFGRPYIMKIDGAIHDGWLSISEFQQVLTADFLYHLLNSSQIQGTMRQRASSGTVQNLNADIVKSLELPIPPLEEQARIVPILDRFETLVNDIKSGLPAEIAARRKQYAYYRDKMLTFKEKPA